MGNLFRLTQGGNRKLGSMFFTSYTSGESCPDSCTLKGAGCYARFSHVGRLWARLSSGDDKRAMDEHQFLASIAALPKGSYFRHNVAGDLPFRKDGVINGDFLIALMKIIKNRKLRAIIYTHHRLNNANIALFNELVAMGLSIPVLSCDTIQDWEKARQLGFNAVVVADSEEKHTNGKTFVRCPAEYQDNVTCQSCMLCQVSAKQNKYSIFFTPHGAGKKKIKPIDLIPVVAI